MISVAPRVGAWIETATTGNYAHSATSRPAWARGLKPFAHCDMQMLVASRPAWARGLKLLEKQNGLLREGRAPRGRVD